MFAVSGHPVPPVSIHHWSDLHRQHVRKSLVIWTVRICKKDICGQIQKAHTDIEVPVHLEVKREFSLLCKSVVPFHLEWTILNFWSTKNMMVVIYHGQKIKQKPHPTKRSTFALFSVNIFKRMVSSSTDLAVRENIMKIWRLDLEIL